MAATEVVLLVGGTDDTHVLGLAKSALLQLMPTGLVCRARACGDDHGSYELETAEQSAIIIAFARAGASFPATVAKSSGAPVVLVPCAAPEDNIAAGAIGSVLAVGTALAPMARVSVNGVEEAVALVQRIVAFASAAGASSASASGSDATAAGRSIVQAVAQADLDLAMGTIDVVEAAQRRTRAYLPLIDAERQRMGAGCGAEAIPTDALPGAERYVGKVRDVYVLEKEKKCVLVATGRQSAFDRHLASIPFKGQVLNQISMWWFQQTSDIMPNHVVCSPNPNVVIGTKCEIFSVEFVVRGYITGSTDTSMWTHYKAGERHYCGHNLPEGLVKNQKLWVDALVTPTTKDKVHDAPISGEALVAEGRMTQAQWELCEAKAKELFVFGSQTARKAGLILVDTKYEFGTDENGNVVLCDEIHTPDSSRYWIASTYEARIAAGQEPENIDKEFLRLWFKGQCDPYKDETLPEAPAELVNELARRYVLLYELITGSKFKFDYSSLLSDTTGVETPDEKIIRDVKKAYGAGMI